MNDEPQSLSRSRPLRSLAAARPVSQVLLESFLVALGVILALAANEWREGREERELAESARLSIHEELEVNRHAVESSLQYHTGLVDTLGSLSRESRSTGEERVPSVRLFSRGFTHPASLLSTAWESARAVDAVRHLAYEDVLVASRVYEAQERYERQSLMSGQIIYRALYEGGTEGIARNYVNLTSILYTFTYRERELLELYDEAIARLSVPESES